MDIPALNADTITPVGARVLLQIHRYAEKTTEGLEVVSGDGNMAPSFGLVLKVGNESKYHPDDYVLFRRYSADILTIDTPDGQIELSLLEDGEVLALVSEQVDSQAREQKYSQIIEKQQHASKSKEEIEGEENTSEEGGKEKDH